MAMAPVHNEAFRREFATDQDRFGWNHNAGPLRQLASSKHTWTQGGIGAVGALPKFSLWQVRQEAAAHEQMRRQERRAPWG
jgi:hypothetical protein